MPWEKTFSESELLERAMRAFWAKGYEGTSVADLVSATGVNRGSLYNAYLDKRNLFVAALGHYDERYRADFLDRIGRENDGKAAILAAFEAAARPADTTTPPGCLLVNTALELSPHDPEVAALVNRSLDAVQGFFETMIRRGQRIGGIDPTVSPESTARALLGLFIGLRVATRAGRDHSTYDAIVAQAEAMLG